MCTWLRKTIFKELKALKGISGFGACNFWRFFREELHQYPTKEDRKYTESGPGTKRGINLLSLGQILCSFFLIFLFLLIDDTPFPKFVRLPCEGVRFYYKWSRRGFWLNDAADCRHAATHRTLSLETLNLMCALTKKNYALYDPWHASDSWQLHDLYNKRMRHTSRMIPD